MERQEFIESIIDYNISDTNLKKIMVPICESSNYYSIMIYDYVMRDISYLLKSFITLNLHNEQCEFYKIFPEKERNYILNFETRIPALATISLSNSEITYGMALSDSFSVDFILNVFLFISSLESIIHYKIINYEEEILEQKKDIDGIINNNLIDVYKYHYSECSIFNLKQRKLWRNAMFKFKLATPEEQQKISERELYNLLVKLEQNKTDLQDIQEELDSLQSCKEYLNKYMQEYRSQYLNIINNIKKEMGGFYEYKI